ncbi:hypothetical protein GCM10008905_09680 [Clostridium malenominatum]|uniref:Inner membrane protein YbaN n=1 Tax=Clostridium malenominatum TaxID=1539 RepID=A0ABN1ITA2_9CLOT
MRGAKKILYITLGIFFLVLGSIGALIPVLPTTPLLLLASLCFVKGSERVDRWFKDTKLYKRHLERYIEARGITMKKKIIILLVSDTIIVISLISSKSIHVKIFLVLLMMIKCYYFIFRINTIKEE